MNTRSLAVRFLFLTALAVLLCFGSKALASPTVAYDDFNDGDFYAEIPDGQEWSIFSIGDSNTLYLEPGGGADGSTAVRFQPGNTVGMNDKSFYINDLQYAFEDEHWSSSWSIGWDECWYPTDSADGDTIVESSPLAFITFYVHTTAGDMPVYLEINRDAETQKTIGGFIDYTKILVGLTVDWPGTFDPFDNGSHDNCFRYHIRRQQDGETRFQAVLLDNGVETSTVYTLWESSFILQGATVNDGDTVGTVVNNALTLDGITFWSYTTDDGYDADVDNILANADGDAWMKDSITVALDDFNDADMVATIPPSSLWRFEYDDPQTLNSVSLQNGAEEGGPDGSYALRWTVGGDDEDVPKANINVEGAFDHVHSSPSFQMKFDERWYAANPNEDQNIESRPIVSIYGIVKTEHNQTEYDKDFKIELKRLAREQRTEIYGYLRGDGVHYHSVFSDHTDFPTGYSGPAEDPDNYRYYLKRALDGTFDVTAVLLDGITETSTSYILGDFDTDMIGLSDAGYEITSNAIEFTKIEFSADSSGRDGYEAAVDNVELTSLANDWDMTQYVDGHPENFDHYVDYRFFGPNNTSSNAETTFKEAMQYSTCLLLAGSTAIAITHGTTIDRDYPLFLTGMMGRTNINANISGNVIFKIVKAPLVNFNNLFITDISTAWDDTRAIETENTVPTRLELQDVKIHYAGVNIGGPGEYIFQGAVIDGGKRVCSPIILNNSNAILDMIGGTVSAACPDEEDCSLDGHACVNWKQLDGRLVIVGASSSERPSDVDIYISSPSLKGATFDSNTAEPHLIAGMRFEPRESQFPMIFVGSTQASVDVMVKANELGTTNYDDARLVDYNANGTLWLIGNYSSRLSGPIYLVDGNPGSSAKIYAFGNLVEGNIDGDTHFLYDCTVETGNTLHCSYSGPCVYTGHTDQETGTPVFICDGYQFDCSLSGSTITNCTSDYATIEGGEVYGVFEEGGLSYDYISPDACKGETVNTKRQYFCDFPRTEKGDNTVQYYGDDYPDCVSTGQCARCDEGWYCFGLGFNPYLPIIRGMECARDTMNGNPDDLICENHYVHFGSLFSSTVLDSQAELHYAGNMYNNEETRQIDGTDFWLTPSSDGGTDPIDPRFPSDGGTSLIHLKQAMGDPDLPDIEIPESIKLTLPQMNRALPGMIDVTDPQGALPGSTILPVLKDVIEDQYSKIQRILDLPGDGRYIYFPAGTYHISEPIGFNYLKELQDGSTAVVGNQNLGGFIAGAGSDRTTIINDMYKYNDELQAEYQPGSVFLSDSMQKGTLSGIRFKTDPISSSTVEVDFPCVSIDAGRMPAEAKIPEGWLVTSGNKFYDCSFHGGIYAMGIGARAAGLDENQHPVWPYMTTGQCDLSLLVDCEFAYAERGYVKGHANAYLNMPIDAYFLHNDYAVGYAVRPDNENVSWGIASFPMIRATIDETQNADFYFTNVDSHAFYFYGIESSSPEILNVRVGAWNNLAVFDHSNFSPSGIQSGDTIIYHSGGMGPIFMNSTIVIDGNTDQVLYKKITGVTWEGFFINLKSIIEGWSKRSIQGSAYGKTRAQAYELEP